MLYSLYHSNPLIDLCTDSINGLGPRHSSVYNNSQVLKQVRCFNGSGIYFRETSLTSLSFCELPKITKLYLEIFRVNGLLEN